MEDYGNLPQRTKQPRSWLEIAGFPNRENVVSNLLAYFFDTNEDHELGDLAIVSLLAAAKIPIKTVLQTAVSRELGTTNKKRLDILVETETAVVVIENKIYASLYNDLNEYSDHAEKIAAKSSKKPIKIVLSPFLVVQTESMQQLGFVAITYADLFKEIRNRLVDPLFQEPPKASTFLHDFMAGIEKIYRATVQDHALTTFFATNEIRIEELIVEYQTGLKRFIGEVSELKSMIQIPADERNISAWIWRDLYLPFDMVFPDGEKICIEYIRRYSGWEINVFSRKKNGQVFYDKAILSRLKILKTKENWPRVGEKIHLESINENNLSNLAKKMEGYFNLMWLDEPTASLAIDVRHS